MRVVTTCPKDGFEQYGKRVLDGWHHWPDAELWWYTEGYDLPETPNVKAIANTKIQALQAFKLEHRNYVAPNYLFDVVRFSHKVYAAIDALFDYKGIGVWMDADCVTYRPIPAGYIEGLLRGKYMALFKRKGMYTETGFWVVDCAHEQHQSFMSVWQEWYDSGAFRQLNNWTDCETLDATLRKFEKGGLVETVNLSGEFDADMHPMSKAELGKYIDHCKGQRKAEGVSPENKHRTERPEPQNQYL